MFALASPAARNVAANACHPKQKATNRCARTRPIKYNPSDRRHGPAQYPPAPPPPPAVVVVQPAASK